MIFHHNIQRNYSLYWRYISPIFNGKNTVVSVTGPLAKSVEDLSLFLKCIFDEKCNPMLSPHKNLKGFNSIDYLSHSKSKLKIGYFSSCSIL
jgi:Asp-tRNA(Asn)/Glu-tRNA(Gln) amidotransferase A subunit family amidase